MADETVEVEPDVDAIIPTVDAGPASQTVTSGVRSVVYEAAPRREFVLPMPIHAVEILGSGTELADDVSEMQRALRPFADVDMQ